MKFRIFLKKLLLFAGAFVLLYALIYISNYIFWVQHFSYYSFSSYLTSVLVFSVMAGFELWVAAAFFGTSVIVGNIVQYNIIRAQGQHVTMAGGMTFGAIMILGFIAGILCQFLLSKRNNAKNK